MFEFKDSPWKSHLRLHHVTGARIRRSSSSSKLNFNFPTLSSQRGITIEANHKTLKQLKIRRGMSLSLCEARAHRTAVEVHVDVKFGVSCNLFGQGN